MSVNKKYLLVVLGPTAVGKTDTTLKLALDFNAEIISCDSRQMYQRMDIGTAKPTIEELDKVPHHFINNLSLEDSYNAGQFEREALEKIKELHEKSDLVLMTGGSGLYINSVCYGFDDLPTVKTELKNEWIRNFKVNGLACLQDKVKELDSEYFENLANDERQNPQRLIRMIGLMISSGKKMKELKKKATARKRPFEIIMIGLNIERAVLYERINQRVDLMIQAGLLDEVKNLLPFAKLNCLKTVGYQEIVAHLQGEYNWMEAVRLVKRNSRRYAKRQMTWFRKDESIKWFHPNEYVDIKDFVIKKMEKQMRC